MENSKDKKLPVENLTREEIMQQEEEKSQRIDEERVVQTHSNLGLVDARPGESTFETGTKNHSNTLDHAFSEVPESVADEIALKDDLSETVVITKEDSLKKVTDDPKA